jgi:type IV pilus assembly protein PilV
MHPHKLIFRNQQGFSIIEAMIAVIILVLGLLGTLGMIINSLKLSSSSNYRSIAGEQAYSMADTLRANPFAIATTTGAAAFDGSVPSAELNCLKAAGCSRDSFVNNQVWVWQQQLANSLPGGAGYVCRDSDPGGHSPTQTAAGAVSSWNCDGTGQYVVKICWNEARISASTPTLGTGGMLCTYTSL